MGSRKLLLRYSSLAECETGSSINYAQASELHSQVLAGRGRWILNNLSELFRSPLLFFSLPTLLLTFATMRIAPRERVGGRCAPLYFPAREKCSAFRERYAAKWSVSHSRYSRPSSHSHTHTHRTAKRKVSSKRAKSHKKLI